MKIVADAEIRAKVAGSAYEAKNMQKPTKL
jgi:hypothetical protein